MSHVLVIHRWALHGRPHSGALLIRKTIKPTHVRSDGTRLVNQLVVLHHVDEGRIHQADAVRERLIMANLCVRLLFLVLLLDGLNADEVQKAVLKGIH